MPLRRPALILLQFAFNVYIHPSHQSSSEARPPARGWLLDCRPMSKWGPISAPWKQLENLDGSCCVATSLRHDSCHVAVKYHGQIPETRAASSPCHMWLMHMYPHSSCTLLNIGAHVVNLPEYQGSRLYLTVHTGSVVPARCICTPQRLI